MDYILALLKNLLFAGITVFILDKINGNLSNLEITILNVICFMLGYLTLYYSIRKKRRNQYWQKKLN